MSEPGTDRGRDRVAAILAGGLVLALVLITGGVLYDAIVSEGPGLSENATQVLTGAFGGILGVLGAYIGFRAGASAATDAHRVDQDLITGATAAQDRRDEPGVGGDTPGPPAQT